MKLVPAFHPKVHLTPIVLAAIVATFGALSWLAAPELALLLFSALLGAAFVTYVAYSYPGLIVVLSFVTGTLLDSTDFVTFDPSIGILRLRFFDPILLGMVLAIGLKLFLGDKRLVRVTLVRLPALSLFLIWLVFTAFRSVIVNDPVATFGEFRTYHQFFVIVLYMAVFFPTRAEQWRLFKLLLWLSFLIIPWGLIAIFFTEGISFAQYGPDMRFISSYKNVSLLWGVVGLYIADRQRLITLKSTYFYGLVLSFVILTVINNHRSVWLSTSASLGLLLLFRRLSPKRQLQVGIGVFLAVIGISLAPTSFNRDLAESIQTRAMAFTNFEQDDTASWRYYLWQRAIQSIREHPVLGVGLGQHFQLADPEGDIITTSPHNEYITVAFHAGITGLVLYLLFLSNMFLLLRSRLMRHCPPKEKVILYTTLMVLAVVSLYYVAYTSEKDFVTWLYIGLGAAALSNAPYRPTQSPRSPEGVL